MAAIGAQSFTIESTLDLPADEYTAEAASSAVYREAAAADAVTLSAGLIDPATGTPYTVGQLEGGIDEYSLTLTPDGVRCQIRGRDRMAELLDRRQEMLYLLSQPAADAEPVKPYRVGAFKASEVAAEVVAAAGLSLSWQCRDYTLCEDFDASGRPIDTLKRLVEPWSQVPRTQVDVFVQGTTVFCRERAASPAADYVFTAHDARIKSLSVHKRRSAEYGRISLAGKMVAKGLQGTDVIQGSEVEETSTSETTDETGQVQTRLIKTTTYRMPDRIVLRVREQTYDRQGGILRLAADKQVENEWETSWYNTTGPTNQPRQLAQSTVTSGIHKDDPEGRFQQIKKESVRFAYEAEGYQDLTTTRRYDLVRRLIKRSGAERDIITWTLEENEREIRALKEVEHLKTEETVSLYRPKGTTGAWYLASVDTRVSAGLRAGGPRPARTIVIGSGDTGPKEPLQLERVQTESGWQTQALPVTADNRLLPADTRMQGASYANPHLTAEDLAYIAAEFEAASGLWEYEIDMTYMAMPWLRKGNVLQITGLVAEDGVTPIPLPPALITGQSLSYNESSDRPEMVSRLRAVFWSAS